MQRFEGASDCPLHGGYTFRAWRSGARVVGDICPTCREEGQRRAQALNTTIDADRARTELAERLNRVGIPVAFQQASFDQLDPKNERVREVYSRARSYVDQFEHVLAMQPARGLILAGAQGTGKTHLVSAMLGVLVRRNYSGLYITANLMLLALRESGRNWQSESAASLINRYASPHLLVIDEYGAHTAHDVDYQHLFAVIDARYQRNRPTVLVTNIEKEELLSHLDERLIERVRGPNGLLLSFNWHSYRMNPTPSQVRT